ncbi:mandelate racemase/muconate lactonizing enzyme family protein [uncultured Nitratireductor sp.]|uniref:mandelate racemase/muconate lactonizing enzyme family protein n=1 Tax=uncultured Nitratireductor sp. TaxID=520953 RepID=UPI0026143544|nr:mandelate racemase/muconate lactonizing enzyme family protein [uncultured Nitratireductor sp.]
MSENDRRILSMTYHEVVVRAHPGVINSEGLDKPLHMLPVGGKSGWSVQFDELPKLLLRLELADGTIGWGEFYRDHNWQTIEAVTSGLLGQNLDDLCLQNLPVPLSREYDGFETAIWDAYARSADVPLHQLLGGKVRDYVKVGAWSSHRETEETGPLARQFQEQGYDCLKFKCDLDDDVVGWCREIAEHAQGMKVILDPNQRWENAGEARMRLRELEKIGNVLLVEDPLPRWQLTEYATLRHTSAVPVVLHVSLPYVFQGQRPYDAINALQHHAVDGFNFNAGLAKFQKLDAIASVANLNCWHGSEIDLGILEHVYVHQAAAASSCIWPSDIFGRMIRSHDLLSNPLEFFPPYVKVPEGPGHGAQPDMDAIENHLVQTRTFTWEG